MRLLDRLTAKISVQPNGCWLWTGYRNRDGYGMVKIGGRALRAMRVVYELVVGPIPAGCELDHRCRQRACVNPAHLEAVAHRVNVLRGDGIMAKNARKTHCARGHEFTPANTRLVSTGRGRRGRRCRTCSREDERKRSKR